MDNGFHDRDRYRGSPLRERRFPGGVATVWSVWVHGDDVEPHGHDEAHLMAVLGGVYHSGAAGLEGRDRDLLIYNPAQTFHHDHFKPGPGAFLSLTFEADEEGLFGTPERPLDVSRSQTSQLLRQLPAAMAAGQTLDLEILLARLKNSLGAFPASEERLPPRWLDQLTGFLSDTPAPLLRDGSREVGIHPVHITRTFRRHLGCTPSEFVQRRRVERAMQAMARDRSLAEVATVSGFADQPHMTRSFKRVMGVTPAQYRHGLRKQRKV